MQPKFCAFFAIFTCKTIAFSEFLITVMSTFLTKGKKVAHLQEQSKKNHTSKRSIDK